MDEPTKAYFENMVEKIDGVSEEVKTIKDDQKKMNGEINHIASSLASHIAYQKGLDVKVRLTKVESELETKASREAVNERLGDLEDVLETKATWSGLKWGLATFFTILTAAVAILALMK